MCISFRRCVTILPLLPRRFGRMHSFTLLTVHWSKTFMYLFAYFSCVQRVSRSSKATVGGRKNSTVLPPLQLPTSTSKSASASASSSRDSTPSSRSSLTQYSARNRAHRHQPVRSEIPSSMIASSSTESTPLPSVSSGRRSSVSNGMTSMSSARSKLLEGSSAARNKGHRHHPTADVYRVGKAGPRL